MGSKIDSLGDTLVYWEVSSEPIHCGIGGFTHDDTAYVGMISDVRLTDITIEEFEAALEQIPDEDIYPALGAEGGRILKVASDDLGVATFIKRPNLSDYHFFRGDDGRGLRRMRELLLNEAQVLETISQAPHPNIVRYHGCRITRGRVSGIVMDKVPGDNLRQLVESRQGLLQVDLEPFMKALISAVEHMHKLGFSHNDICPNNVMVEGGRPVLIDFGSCRRTGERMVGSGGSIGWEEDGDEYIISKESHDLAGLAKIRQWMSEKSS